MRTAQPILSTRPSGGPESSWVGPDTRGLELEVIAAIAQTDAGEQGKPASHAMGDRVEKETTVKVQFGDGSGRGRPAVYQSLAAQ